MIYLAIISSFLLLSYVYDYRGRERHRLFWWLLMLAALICLAGFRYQMGGDSARYERYYEESPGLADLRSGDFRHTRFAPLYIIFSSACRSITPEFMLLQFIEAIFVNAIFFRFIWKHSRHVFFCGFLYFFFLYIILNMEVIREAFAVAVFLLSWPFLEKKRWIPYYALCVLAFFFHMSAIALFLVPVIYIPGIRELFVFGKRTLIIIPVLLALSFVVKYFLFDFIRLIAVTESMAERASTYSHNELGGNTLNVMGAVGGMVRYALYPLIALYFLKKENGGGKRKAKDVPLMERMALAGVYAATLSIGIMILIRYINYFEIFALIVLADWFFTGVWFRGKLVRLNFFYWMVIAAPLVSAQFYVEYWTTMNRSGTVRIIDKYVPYTSQFEREMTPKRKRAIELSQPK